MTAGKHTERLDVQGVENTVTIDLSRPVPRPNMRKVVLRIVTPDAAIQPSGSIQVYAATRDRGVPAVIINPPIEDGKVAFDAPVPGYVSYRPQSVLGYWFKDGVVDIEPGTEPKTIEVQGVPAAGIVGQVFDPDGKPAAANLDLGCSAVEKPPALKNESINLNNIRTDAQGRFFLSPLPIGGTYVVVAAQGHNKQVSRPVTLDGTKAIERVELRMTKPVVGSGRVLGPDGKPLRGVPVTLRLDHPQAGTSWSPPTLTDAEGRFRFDDLSAEIGPYKVSLDLHKDYQPAEAKLNPGGAPVEIHLRAGHVVEGRVLDATTGWPIPGVEMYAYLRKLVRGETVRGRGSDRRAGALPLQQLAGRVRRVGR